MLKKLTTHWFTRPVQITIFSVTELIVLWDMYRHRTHPAQAFVYILLALVLAVIWWRASRANTRDAYDNVNWISMMAVSGLFLIPDFVP